MGEGERGEKQEQKSNSTNEGLGAPSKILNFGVSGGCLWSVWEVSGGVKHCLDSVWAEGEGFLPVFFIIVS